MADHWSSQSFTPTCPSQLFFMIKQQSQANSGLVNFNYPISCLLWSHDLLAELCVATPVWTVLPFQWPSSLLLPNSFWLTEHRCLQSQTKFCQVNRMLSSNHTQIHCKKGSQPFIYNKRVQSLVSIISIWWMKSLD